MEDQDSRNLLFSLETLTHQSLLLFFECFFLDLLCVCLFNSNLLLCLSIVTTELPLQVFFKLPSLTFSVYAYMLFDSKSLSCRLLWTRFQRFNLALFAIVKGGLLRASKLSKKWMTDARILCMNFASMTP